jgi:hypothetical protein
MLDEAADVLTCNAYVNNTDVDAGLIACILDSLLNSLNGFVDVKDNTFHDTFAFSFAHTEHFELAKLVLAADNRTDLGCTDVEPNYDFRIFHDLIFL